MRLQFEENKFFRQVAPTSKKQLNLFSNTNISTTLTPPGPPGVSKEAKSSTEFEFGGLVRYNWAQNPESLKNRRKTFIFLCFFVISEIFPTLFNFGWIVARQTTKFELSGQFCFFRHPWGSWGRQSSGLKQELANSVTVYMDRAIDSLSGFVFHLQFSN